MASRTKRHGQPYPDGKRFAFTILDDTDDATVENVRPVYTLLAELGFRTTKTVWPLDCPEGSPDFFAAETLGDSKYLDFCLELAAQGFEITWHCATMESSMRARTIRGLERMREVFGRYPSLHANHATNRENIYWGAERYRTRLIRTIARLRLRESYGGADPTSPYFWGDLCQRHFRYVRNFAFARLNTLDADPDTPYRLHDTPFVQSWFSTSDAPDLAAFRRLVNRRNIDRLCETGGVCILSTHLGKGFVTQGKVDPIVVETLQYISSLPGWFVPVTRVLDFLAGPVAESPVLSRHKLLRLELTHVLDRLRA